MAGDVPPDNPVAVGAPEPLTGDQEPAPDRLIGVGDAARVGAPDEPLDEVRDLDPFLLADLVVPDDIDGRMGGYQRDPVHLFF